jgi:polygalacturonase
MMKLLKISAASFALALVASVAGAQIPQPLINNGYVVVVTNATYGAIGDSVTTNTTAIQNAINAAAVGAVTNGMRGGVVEIPVPSQGGTYLSGPLVMTNYVDLQIDKGATLQMLPYLTYPTNLPPALPASFIGVTNKNNIEISGFGAIDGQGGPWWVVANTNSSLLRPYALFQCLGCSTVMVCNVTFQNPPNVHLNVSASSSTSPSGNVLITNMTINTPDGSPNTDGIDMDATNVEVVNSFISDGDDHIAIGGTTAFMHDILVTNCLFGTGHGMSIGSYTSAGISNLLVINCGWNGSENGIRDKSERSRGGLVQDLVYMNLNMTNVQWPFMVYSYYQYGVGTLTAATPYMAATDAVEIVTNKATPMWRNIVVSNLTATTSSSSFRPACMIWGLPEMSISNVTLYNININGSVGAKTCQFYYVTNLEFINSSISVAAHTPIYTCYADQMIISNSFPSAGLYTFDGLTTNIFGNFFGNSLGFYNAPASLLNTNAIANGTLNIGSGTFTASNNLTMAAATFNYQLGTSAATVVVKGNLAEGGTVNVTAGPGFTNGTYTLFTYTGTLSGSSPTLGSVPAGYNYAFNTGTAGQVNLVVSLPAPVAPANLTARGTNVLIGLQWSAPVGATGYNLMRSTTNGGPYGLLASPGVTNYSDTAVNPGTVYYYVISATNISGASPDSSQASATPLPSLNETNLTFQLSANELQLSWPQDHQGWRLEVQTNDLNTGLSTNWVTVPNSTNIISTNMVINATNGSVFFRMVYP